MERYGSPRIDGNAWGRREWEFAERSFQSRYQCAAGSYEVAVGTIKAALAARGESIRRATAFFLEKDGEFTRLCRPVVGELRKLID